MSVKVIIDIGGSVVQFRCETLQGIDLLLLHHAADVQSKKKKSLFALFFFCILHGWIDKVINLKLYNTAALNLFVQCYIIDCRIN